MDNMRPAHTQEQHNKKMKVAVGGEEGNGDVDLPNRLYDMVPGDSHDGLKHGGSGRDVRSTVAR